MRSRSDCWPPNSSGRPCVEPSVEGVQIDLEDEDSVEELQELGEVPGATAEEGDRLGSVGGESTDQPDVPEMMPV